MAVNFIPLDRETPEWFPATVQEYLPEHHLAPVVVDIVDQLDLRHLLAAYAGPGSQPYHPVLLVAETPVALRAPCVSAASAGGTGLVVATVIGAFLYALYNKLRGVVVSARLAQTGFLAELEALFTEILLIAQAMGVLKLGTVSLDGTKIKANTSKYKALSWEHAQRTEAQLKDEVAELMRLGEQAEFERKQAQREAAERETDKKAHGPAPQPPVSGPRAKDQVNLTDEQSRIMPTANGFVQGFNAQAGVDVATHLIVEQHVSDQPNDKQEVAPAVVQLSTLPPVLGQVETLLADTGYHRAGNVVRCEAAGIEPLIPAARQPHNPPLTERFADDPPAPNGPSPVKAMEKRLRTQERKARYAKRRAIAETVFVMIKHMLGFRQFLLRGLRAVQGELTRCVLDGTRSVYFLSDSVAALKSESLATFVGMLTLARCGFLEGRLRVFDYGCGRGDDVRGLLENGIEAAGWDPHFAPDNPITTADIVNLGFVVNVIEDLDERVEALTRAWSLARTLLVVSVMLANQNDVAGERFRDGVMTRRGTFQRYYTQAEIKAFLESVLDEEAIAIAPGVLYVFRDKDLEQRFLVDRYRSRNRRLPRHSPRAPARERVERAPRPRRDPAAERYAACREPLDRLWALWIALGRRPDAAEVPDPLPLTEGFGCLTTALRFLAGQHDPQELESARAGRIADMTVYFALDQFARRRPYRCRWLPKPADSWRIAQAIANEGGEDRSVGGGRRDDWRPGKREGG